MWELCYREFGLGGEECDVCIFAYNSQELAETACKEWSMTSTLQYFVREVNQNCF